MVLKALVSYHEEYGSRGAGLVSNAFKYGDNNNDKECLSPFHDILDVEKVLRCVCLAESLGPIHTNATITAYPYGRYTPMHQPKTDRFVLLLLDNQPIRSNGRPLVVASLPYTT